MWWNSILSQKSSCNFFYVEIELAKLLLGYAAEWPSVELIVINEPAFDGIIE